MKTRNGILTNITTVVATVALGQFLHAGNGTQGPCSNIKDSTSKKMCLSAQSYNSANGIPVSSLVDVQGQCISAMAQSFITQIYGSDSSFTGQVEFESQSTAIGKNYRNNHNMYDPVEFIDLKFDQSIQILPTVTKLKTKEGCQFTMVVTSTGGFDFPEAEMYWVSPGILFEANMTHCSVAEGDQGISTRKFTWQSGNVPNKNFDLPSNGRQQTQFSLFKGAFLDIPKVDAAGNIKEHQYIATNVSIIESGNHSNSLDFYNSDNFYGSKVASYSSDEYRSCLSAGLTKLSVKPKVKK